MGIESDQLVYDYLSRVGDLAQQRQLPASDRMKLVSTLRNEIDRRRATHGEESPSAVRGILGALGTPDEVVERADPGASGLVPEPRKGEEPDTAPSDDSRVTDWWRADEADGVPGFVGGVERPDLFSPPPPEKDEEDEQPEPAPGKRRRLARIIRLRRRPGPGAEAEATAEPAAEPETAPAPRPRLRLSNPFVLLAALLLLGGAAFSSLIALAAGWLLAYGSRRLTPGEVKAAVLVIPGAAAASGAVWLWGRVEGRWGAEVAAGGEALGAAISETWPWVLRGAAIASALFLLWRSRRN
ncbi:hypothetical protein AB0M38_21190 [Streptomyces sp. NPDC051742]|uniref:hypothetical protein n=1 Tax=unclassified Streptomyces TaxID=2593676 RepID=UPI003424A5C3